MKRCPICKKKLVLPRGPEESPYLILSVKPGTKELETGRPMAGYAGRILRIELGRVGLDMLSMRISNLFLHATTPNKKSVLDEDCYEWHLEQAVLETADRKLVFLMGSDVVKAFCGVGVMTVSGLQVTSHLISSKTQVVAGPNPADAIHHGVGELRLAIKAFKDLYEEKRLVAELGYG